MWRKKLCQQVEVHAKRAGEKGVGVKILEHVGPLSGKLRQAIYQCRIRLDETVEIKLKYWPAIGGES